MKKLSELTLEKEERQLYSEECRIAVYEELLNYIEGIIRRDYKK